jgi:hypothetical protein
VHALHRAERETCGRVGKSRCETVDSNLHLSHFSRTTFISTDIGKDFPNFGGVFAKNRRDQFFAFWGERYDPDAAILRTLDPDYQSPFDEAVHSRTDRAGRKGDRTTSERELFRGRITMLLSPNSAVVFFCCFE